MVVTFYSPTNKVWGFQFPHIFTHILVLSAIFITAILVGKKWLLIDFLKLTTTAMIKGYY